MNYTQDYIKLIENAYQHAKNEKSDINEHISFLYELGKECKHITEMGVRFGSSTRAFMKTHAVLRSYDLFLDARLVEIFEELKRHGRDAQYIKADVLNIMIDETDLLFIDTWHSYAQLKAELKLHGNKARKYLVFHDTYTYGLKDESWDKNKAQDDGVHGLLPAIIDFVIENPHWRFKAFRTNNNGLTVLERF